MQNDHEFDFRGNTRHVSIFALKNGEWSSQISLPKLIVLGTLRF